MAWHSLLGSAGSEVLSHSRCWIMVVSDCWKTIRPEGPVRSVHSQLGKQGFPLTRPRLYFYFFFCGWKRGHVKVNVYATACEIIFSRCIYIYKPSWKRWNSHFIWQETLLDMWAHLCGAYLASYDVHLPVHVCPFLCVLVYFSLAVSWLLIFFSWRMIMDPESFPVDRGKVVTHGNCWVTLPPAAIADRLTNREAMQAFTISYFSLGGCVLIPNLITLVGLLHSEPSLPHMLW